VAILSAAQNLFQRRGYAAVSVNDIANEIGITKAAVLYYFPTKADLYGAVMRAVLMGIQHGIRAMTAVPGPVSDKLRRLATYAIVSLESNADLDAMMRDADEHLDPAQVKELSQAHAAIITALAEMMEDGMASGELAAGDANLLALAFWHVLSGFAGRTGTAGGYQGRPEVAATLVDLFLHGAVPSADEKGVVNREKQSGIRHLAPGPYDRGRNLSGGGGGVGRSPDVPNRE
jgi:AcrR family transcriptional regulator